MRNARSLNMIDIKAIKFCLPNETFQRLSSWIKVNTLFNVEKMLI
jgi:hypothetical protein